MTTVQSQENQDAEVQEAPVKLVQRGLYNRPLPEDEINEDNSATSPDATQTSADPTDTDPSATTETVDTSGNIWQKRYSDLRRHETKLSKRVKDLEEQLSKRAGVEPPPIDPKQFEEWKAKYPVLQAAIDKVVQDRVQEVVKRVEPRIEEVELATADIEAEKAMIALQKRHNDWPELSESPEFKQWVDAQPVSIQNDFYNSFDVDAVARHVDIYKLEKGVKSQPKSQLNKRPIVTNEKEASMSTTKARGADVGSDGKRIWTVEDIQKLSGREFERYEADIEAAMKEGRIR